MHTENCEKDHISPLLEICGFHSASWARARGLRDGLKDEEDIQAFRHDLLCASHPGDTPGKRHGT